MCHINISDNFKSSCSFAIHETTLIRTESYKPFLINFIEIFYEFVHSFHFIISIYTNYKPQLILNFLETISTIKWQIITFSRFVQHHTKDMLWDYQKTDFNRASPEREPSLSAYYKSISILAILRNRKRC